MSKAAVELLEVKCVVYYPIFGDSGSIKRSVIDFLIHMFFSLDRQNMNKLKIKSTNGL